MGGVDTQPDLPAAEPRWLPPGAWRWIAAAVPAGAILGLTAAALVGLGPVDPDTGATRTVPTLATPPPTSAHITAPATTRPAPRSTVPVVVAPAPPKGHDEPDTTPRTPPAPAPQPPPSRSEVVRTSDADGSPVAPSPVGSEPCDPPPVEDGSEHGDGTITPRDLLDVAASCVGAVVDPGGPSQP
jgi:hypothetical protein